MKPPAPPTPFLNAPNHEAPCLAASLLQNVLHVLVSRLQPGTTRRSGPPPLSNIHPSSRSSFAPFLRALPSRSSLPVSSHPKQSEERPRLSGQSGALFGLDARIALAIFSIISVVAGAAMVLNMNSTHAKSLAQELTDTTRAIESMHNDLQTDVYQALDHPTDKNAFQALYDPSVITNENNLRNKWHGPYIKFTSTVHPNFGEMLIQKRSENHTEQCNDEDLCYLWLVYGTTPLGVAKETNEILDGQKEENPGTSGRIQWTTSAGNQNALYYRAARALTNSTGE